MPGKSSLHNLEATKLKYILSSTLKGQNVYGSGMNIKSPVLRCLYKVLTSIVYPEVAPLAGEGPDVSARLLGAPHPGVDHHQVLNLVPDNLPQTTVYI